MYITQISLRKLELNAEVAEIQDGGIISIITQNRNFSPKLNPMWRSIHAHQTFKWNELHWTTRLRSRAARSLGHVVFDLVRIWSCRYSFWRYFRAEFHTFAHIKFICAKVWNLKIENNVINNILVMIIMFSSKIPSKWVLTRPYSDKVKYHVT